MTFQYVEPTEDQLILMDKYRYKFEELSRQIIEDINDSRGKSLTLTKLEESAFWLNKAITNNT